jgi:hypothetical protein
MCTSASAEAVPMDPTAYYKDYWQYAAYYGEAAARLYYGAWSPPVGTAPPADMVIPADPAAAAAAAGTDATQDNGDGGATAGATSSTAVVDSSSGSSDSGNNSAAAGGGSTEQAAADDSVMFKALRELCKPFLINAF